MELCVQDSGPGMAPAEMQRLGERFFRVLGTDQPGSGLGWSIVKRIADVTGAGVQIARSQALGGMAVTVVWPT
jgi:two-component system sensor histidine kinase QseC